MRRSAGCCTEMKSSRGIAKHPLGAKKEWCIPPEQNAAFVCQMEEVLSIYTQPYDAERPGVCLEESSKQLIGEVRHPIPIEPGQPERFDSEYSRKGVANL